MKIPTWLKALIYLRFVVCHDGTTKRFWSYEKALKYKNDVKYESKFVSFLGWHILKGWKSFYYKSPNVNIIDLPKLKNDVIKLEKLTAEAKL